MSFSTGTQYVANTVATASVASPWWLPYVYTVSEAAAIALPILGCLYLVIQIVGYVRKNFG